MSSQKQVLLVRHIAARFISAELPEGLAQLDEVVGDWYRSIQLGNRVWYGVFMFSSTLFLFFAILTIIGSVKNIDNSSVAILALLALGGGLGSALYWRIRQYGGFRPGAVQAIKYGNPEHPAVSNLDRFFQFAKTETTSRAFFLTRNGDRREIRREYFFGSWRLALLAEDPTIKAVMFSPWGLWFDKEVYMEVDVEALIAQTKAKPEPKKRGPDPTYDFTDAIMSLIEHPEIRKLDPEWGSQTPIAGLLKEWFQKNNRPVPGKTTLTKYASDVQAAIKKNRAKKS